MKRSTSWRTVMTSWRPSTVLHSLDLALIDPPLLCCDDDELCAACRTESDLLSH